MSGVDLTIQATLWSPCELTAGPWDTPAQCRGRARTSLQLTGSSRAALLRVHNVWQQELLSSLPVPGTLPPQHMSFLLFLCLECSSPGPGKRQTLSQPSYLALNISHSLKPAEASHQIPLCYASLFPCLCSSYH